jgi:hypothetical protein
MRNFGWSCVALYCLMQLGIVSPDWLKGQWNSLTARQTAQGEVDTDLDIRNDGKQAQDEDGKLYE